MGGFIGGGEMKMCAAHRQRAFLAAVSLRELARNKSVHGHSNGGRAAHLSVSEPPC